MFKKKCVGKLHEFSTCPDSDADYDSQSEQGLNLWQAGTMRQHQGWGGDICSFPTCQVRVVRFYVSCRPRPLPAGPQPRAPAGSVPGQTSTASQKICQIERQNVRRYARKNVRRYTGKNVRRYTGKNVRRYAGKSVTRYARKNAEKMFQHMPEKLVRLKCHGGDHSK